MRAATSGNRDDKRNCYRQPRSARHVSVTFTTYVATSVDGAPPTLSTAVGPPL